MATREAVFENFGRAAQFAQLLEQDIGTALLAIDALDTGSHLNPDADAYLRLRSAIDGQTLGRSLGKIKSLLQLPDDIETQFSAALSRRNSLIHGFFARHGLKFLNESGRDEMVLELQSIATDLNTAWRVAQRLSEVLVQGVMMSAQLRSGVKP